MWNKTQLRDTIIYHFDIEECSKVDQICSPTSNLFHWWNAKFVSNFQILHSGSVCLSTPQRTSFWKSFNKSTTKGQSKAVLWLYVAKENTLGTVWPSEFILSGSIYSNLLRFQKLHLSLCMFSFTLTNSHDYIKHSACSAKEDQWCQRLLSNPHRNCNQSPSNGEEPCSKCTAHTHENESTNFTCKQTKENSYSWSSTIL